MLLYIVEAKKGCKKKSLNILSLAAYLLKRKSNEEQLKHNAKVICKLDEATENIEALSVEKGKGKITEGKKKYSIFAKLY